ncbi:helix-turn-helix domain-containing protein [Mycobacteroides abscessus]|uniref:helix-turn-helix domain-containing protein n=1 Tax=Mycobacteroides abscessus TaxID=36809 RepID=UPI001F366B45|nr:helix-turn-helix transcriptional regulator [Mycobacteroides abscessus]
MAHALSRWLNDQLAAYGYTVAELADKAQISRTYVYKLLNDERPYLPQMPSPALLTGLANAFPDVDEALVRSIALQATGGTDNPTASTEDLTELVTKIPTGLLLAELARRDAMLRDAVNALADELDQVNYDRDNINALLNTSENNNRRHARRRKTT